MFTTKNISLGGTFLQGYVQASYEKLVSIFGEPQNEGDGYKVDCEWAIEFDDGTIASIYNWKNGKNYCGSLGLEIEKITNWNVGGRNPKALELVEKTLKIT